MQWEMKLPLTKNVREASMRLAALAHGRYWHVAADCGTRRHVSNWVMNGHAANGRSGQLSRADIPLVRGTPLCATN
jgi:hypothetical protein